MIINSPYPFLECKGFKYVSPYDLKPLDFNMEFN